jgi:hypothetical protein
MLIDMKQKALARTKDIRIRLIVVQEYFSPKKNMKKQEYPYIYN